MSHNKQKNLDTILGVGWKRNTRILNANTSRLLYRHFLRRSRVNPPSATLSPRAVVTRLSFRAVSCCADDGGYRPRPGRHAHQVGACNPAAATVTREGAGQQTTHWVARGQIITVSTGEPSTGTETCRTPSYDRGEDATWSA